MYKSSVLTSLLVLCVGCSDPAARQQRAEEARTQQTKDDLRELGQKMHNNPSNESADDPQNAGASSDHE